MGFIHITYLMQREILKLEALIFPYGPLSLSADTTVSLGYVKINTYHSRKGADPYSETVGAKSIHTESFGGCFFSQVSNLHLGSEGLNSCSRCVWSVTVFWASCIRISGSHPREDNSVCSETTLWCSGHNIILDSSKNTGTEAPVLQLVRGGKQESFLIT